MLSGTEAQIAIKVFGAGNLRELLTQLAGYLIARASRFERIWSLYFRYIHPERVLVELGTAGLAGHCAYLGHRHNHFFGKTTHLVAFFKRDSGQSGHVYGERAFVEHREETAAQRKEHGHRHHKYASHSDEHGLDSRQRTRQHLHISVAHHPRKFRLTAHLSIFRCRAEHERTQHGGDGKGHNGGGHQGHDKRHAKRNEHTALYAGEEEKRQEAGDDDKR